MLMAHEADPGAATDAARAGAGARARHADPPGLGSPASIVEQGRRHALPRRLRSVAVVAADGAARAAARQAAAPGVALLPARAVARAADRRSDSAVAHR